MHRGQQEAVGDKQPEYNSRSLWVKIALQASLERISGSLSVAECIVHGDDKDG